jgi:hypothetical protein
MHGAVRVKIAPVHVEFVCGDLPLIPMGLGASLEKADANVQ